MDPEWESFYHVIDEVDGACLIVPSVDLQGPDPRGVIDGRVLVIAVSVVRLRS
jgi:hypothetical protein